MSVRLVGRILLGAVVVSGCAKQQVKPPDARTITVGTFKGDYRDYAGVDVCRVDPTVLQKDLDSMNGLLARFLQVTNEPKEGQWDKARLDVLEQGARVLPPALSAEENTVTKLAACEDRPRGIDVDDQVAKARELVRQTRHRVGDAPQILAYVRTQGELAAWRQKLKADQESERATWCPPKPSKIPEIYFAWADESGQIEWLFCDGSKVVQAPGQAAQYVRPSEETSRRGRPVPPETFLTNATKFPTSEIRHQPKIGEGGSSTGGSQP